MVTITPEECPRCGAPHVSGQVCAWCARLKRHLKSVKRDVAEAKQFAQEFTEATLQTAKEQGYL